MARGYPPALFIAHALGLDFLNTVAAPRAWSSSFRHFRAAMR
jgi:hypothetical protein